MNKIKNFKNFVKESYELPSEEEILSNENSTEEVDEAKKWIQDAIKRPGSLRRKMKKKEDLNNIYELEEDDIENMSDEDLKKLKKSKNVYLLSVIFIN